MTDEPGIYFIPALIDDWRARGLYRDFLNYDLLETYKDLQVESVLEAKYVSKADFSFRIRLVLAGSVKISFPHK